MKKIEVELLSDMINSVVIKFPERRYPGVLLQGDTLRSLYDSVVEIKEVLNKQFADEDILEEISERINQLHAYLQNYERALKAHNIDLPYVVSVDDSKVS